MIMLWLWSKCSSIILVILIKMSPLTNLVLSSPRLTSSSLRPKLKTGSVHLYCTAIYSTCGPAPGSLRAGTPVVSP